MSFLYVQEFEETAQINSIWVAAPGVLLASYRIDFSGGVITQLLQDVRTNLVELHCDATCSWDLGPGAFCAPAVTKNRLYQNDRLYRRVSHGPIVWSVGAIANT